MTAAHQLALACVPDPRGPVVEVDASFCRGDAEVAMRFAVLVRLADRAPGEPLVEPMVATVIETGADVPQDEIDAMWRNDSFRVAVTRAAYSAAVKRHNPRR